MPLGASLAFRPSAGTLAHSSPADTTDCTPLAASLTASPSTARAMLSMVAEDQSVRGSGSCLPDIHTEQGGSLYDTDGSGFGPSTLLGATPQQLMRQGERSLVYVGVWHSAPVAIKYVLVEALAPGASEAVLGPALVHPNVLQTFEARVVQLAPHHFEGSNSSGSKISTNSNHSLVPAAAPTVPGSLQVHSSSPSLRSMEANVQHQHHHADGPSHYGHEPGADVLAAGGALAHTNIATPGAITRALEMMSAQGLAATSFNGFPEGAAGTSSGTGPGTAELVGPITGRLNRHARITLAPAQVLHDSNNSDNRSSKASPDSLDDLVHDTKSLLVRLDGPSPGQTTRPSKQHSAPGWLLHVLSLLKAQPSQYLTEIVTELCDRGTLKQATLDGAFSPGAPGNGGSRRAAMLALVRTAREVSQGMCHLHACHVLHADLKPDNILLRSSGADARGFVAKISDFGLSRLAGISHSHEEGSSGMPGMGSVSYQSPEALQGMPVRTSDVWSFGIVLHFMSTGGQPAYPGLRLVQIMMGVMEGSIAPQWPTQTYRPVRNLAELCLNRDPAQRPSFRRIVVALEHLEEHLLTAQPATTPRARASQGPAADAAASQHGLGAAASTSLTAPSYGSWLANRSEVGLAGASTGSLLPESGIAGSGTYAVVLGSDNSSPPSLDHAAAAASTVTAPPGVEQGHEAGPLDAGSHTQQRQQDQGQQQGKQVARQAGSVETLDSTSPGPSFLLTSTEDQQALLPARQGSEAALQCEDSHLLSTEHSRANLRTPPGLTPSLTGVTDLTRTGSSMFRTGAPNSNTPGVHLSSHNSAAQVPMVQRSASSGFDAALVLLQSGAAGTSSTAASELVGLARMAAAAAADKQPPALEVAGARAALTRASVLDLTAEMARLADLRNTAPSAAWRQEARAAATGMDGQFRSQIRTFAAAQPSPEASGWASAASASAHEASASAQPSVQQQRSSAPLADGPGYLLADPETMPEVHTDGQEHADQIIAALAAASFSAPGPARPSDAAAAAMAAEARDWAQERPAASGSGGKPRAMGDGQ